MKDKPILYILIALLVLYCVNSINTTSNLEKDNTELNNKVIRLQEQNSIILLKLKRDSIIIQEKNDLIKQLEYKDTLRQKKLIKINKDYETLYNSYITATRTYKDSIFTELINN